MRRRDTLQLRLDDLKTEFRSLLITELEKVAAGRWSRYLSRKESPYPVGRFWANRESDHLGRLEKDIQTLAHKLHDAQAVTLLSMVAGYVDGVASDRDRSKGGRAHIARQVLRQLSRKEPAT